MKVHIPSSLRSYTGSSIVDAEGTTLAELLADLDRMFPGLRFRVVDEQGAIREHIKIFVDQRIAQDLAEPLTPECQVRFIMAISGGQTALPRE